jgi:hypothetical protein
MKIDRFDLILERNLQQYYLAGEEIKVRQTCVIKRLIHLKGHIEIAVRERVRVARLSLRMIGACHTAWQDDFTDIPYESGELFLEEYRDLTRLADREGLTILHVFFYFSDLSIYCNEAMEILWGEYKLLFRMKVFSHFNP